jgi:predicted MFS family arabinose efflux permease
VLIGATLVLGGAFALMALLEQGPLLLVTGAISGVAMAHVFVPSAPYLADNSTMEQRRAAFAANFGALSLASVLGSALGGIVPSLLGGGDSEQSVLGYRVALLAGGIFSGLGALPLLFADDTRAPGSLPAPTAPGSAPPKRARSVRRDMIAMAIATALLASSTGLVVQFFNVFLRDVVLVPTAEIGTIFAAAALAMAPGSFVGPLFARRIGSVAAIVLPRLLTAPIILLLAILPWSGLVCGVIYILRSGLVAISQPLDNAFAMELVSPRDRARVAALRTVSWNGGWAIATGLGGIAILHVGYPAIFAIAAALTFGSVAAHWAAFRDR